MLKKLLNSVLILLTVVSIVSSTVENWSVEEIEQLQKALDESSKYMASKVKNEDAVICIGATSSGKSTLINYLIGNELVAKRPASDSPIVINKADENSPGPEIGGGSTSKTIIPTRWISKNLTDLVIWDVPGFDDNRGAIQDITNAFYLYQLLQKVKSLRIALIIDINNIFSDNIKPFVSVLNSVQRLFRYNRASHLYSLSVIFTKVPDTLNDVPVDIQLIRRILNDQFLKSNMSLSQDSKDIVQFLVDKPDHISFFKSAKIGKITPDIDVNIFPAIIKSWPLGNGALKDVYPINSISAMIQLYKSRSSLLSVGAFNVLKNVVSSVIKKTVQNLENSSNIEEEEKETMLRISQLNEIERKLYEALTDELDFLRRIEIVRSIDTDIENAIEEHNLLEKVHLVEFVDTQLGFEASNQFALSLQRVLLSSDSKVREAIASANLRLGRITLEKYDEMVNEEWKRHVKEMKKINSDLKDVRKRNKETEKWIDLYIENVSAGRMVGLRIGGFSVFS